MNIYLHELKTKLPSVLIWSASLAILILVFLSMFQGFAADAAMVTELMNSFPKELLIAFGMTDMDFSTILGFFGLIFVFCQICLAIQAANYGVGLVSVEETEWTADFLLSKPVRRDKDHDEQVPGCHHRAGNHTGSCLGEQFPVHQPFSRGSGDPGQAAGIVAAQHDRVSAILPHSRRAHLAFGQAYPQHTAHLDGAGIRPIHPERLRRDDRREEPGSHIAVPAFCP